MSNIQPLRWNINFPPSPNPLYINMVYSHREHRETSGKTSVRASSTLAPDILGHGSLFSTEYQVVV